MQNFEFLKAKSINDTLGTPPSARFLAGGTTLIDLMKLEVENPTQIVDINPLPLNEVRENTDGSFFVGALVRNSELAHHPKISKHFPVLSQAILAGASAQLRNKATTGGNLLQRTRCVYFRDTSKPCNKRKPSSGCAAIQGFNRNLAILGTSDHCIASNPSDMNVAMMALNAVVHLQSASGERKIPIQEFYLLPGVTPHLETVVQEGELITGVTLFPFSSSTRSLYVKLRDRQSYEFAIASTAVIAEMKGGQFSRIQIAMGGIGTRPWRCVEAEKILLGRPATLEHFTEAAHRTLEGAKPQSENAFKIEVARRCLIHTLKQVSA